ncbi:hypothetical protein UFOVP1196_69 [uncultured Caudovirales phage]|uniref:Glycosyl transferases group 1 n=1 Tax=uncultured Caudovirales phage TaxID=2100421 RepID=A0A6J5RFT8_9CAUD|nr:hypothetical protein UFOVP1196_69 [uncultured Caudovirales phage]
MKVFTQAPPDMSRAMYRVAHALELFAPSGITVVPTVEEADLVILHVTGYQDTFEYIQKLKQDGKKFAIMQYCYVSTGHGAEDWMPLWNEAVFVWSYYRLPAPRHYFAPLGVDSNVFQDSMMPRRPYTVMTSGYIAEAECAFEAAEASRRVGWPMLHLGPTLKLGFGVSYYLDIRDKKLASLYSMCQFVAGLRRCEGFEMPAAEGLLCGARPIMFDAPHYRDWFGGLAEFIPEDDSASVTDTLEALFRDGARPVSYEEKWDAKQRFDWQRLVTGFWTKVLHA